VSRRFHFLVHRYSTLTAPGSSVIGCERIAPVTHQDQASGPVAAIALAAQAAPEERWFRFVSNR
jgi:hypothetical protein